MGISLPYKYFLKQKEREFLSRSFCSAVKQGRVSAVHLLFFIVIQILFFLFLFSTVFAFVLLSHLLFLFVLGFRHS